MVAILIIEVRHSSILVFFFFFQAEDGIRDYKVTGVQTCALPILTPTSGGTVLKVVAGGTGFLDSLVVSNTYTLPVASTPVCTPGTGTYYNTQSVSCTNPSSAPVVCYTTNGTTPATNGVTGCITGTVVSGSISITSTGTNLQVIAGGSGLTDSSPSSTTYTLIVAAPTFSPAGGFYSSSQNVTVSMTTSGASILYCFDTTNACTPGTSYAGPVAVSSSGFLRAQATLPGFANSSISSAQYFIGVAPPIALVQANTTWTACSTTSSVCSVTRSEEHTSELQSPCNLVCRLLLEK